MAYQTRDRAPLLDSRTHAAIERRGKELLGLALVAGGLVTAMMLGSYSPEDPNWMLASDAPTRNWLGTFGASVAHPLMMIVGRAAWGIPLALLVWGLRLATHRADERARSVFAPIWVASLAAALAALTPGEDWTHAFGLGGLFGDTAMGIALTVLPLGTVLVAMLLWALTLAFGAYVLGVTRAELADARRAGTLALVVGYDRLLRWGLRAATFGAALWRDGRHRGAAALSAAMAARQAAAARRAAAPAPIAPATAPVSGIARPSTVRATIVRAQPGTGGRAHVMPPMLHRQPGAAAAPTLVEAFEDDDGAMGCDMDAPGPLASGPDHSPVALAALPLAAPARAPQPPTSFLATLLRRARGDEAPEPEQDPATDEDRLRARISEAIRARGQSAPAPQLPPLRRPEPMLAAPRTPSARAVPPPVTAPVAAAGATSALGSALGAVGRAPLATAIAAAAAAGTEALRTAAVARSAPPAVAPPEDEGDLPPLDVPAAPRRAVAAPAARPVAAPAPAPAAARPAAPRPAAPAAPPEVPYETPPLALLADPAQIQRHHLADEALEQNARDLEGVLDDYGVKGEITSVRPGPVVTMYELEPAPGLKASRVIGLADDIARSMSALSARVSTVPGRSVIGIELPNDRREKVVLREILTADDFHDAQMRLPLALGKDIGGQPVIVNLAKMPHLLIAGTTGSGKSVAINTMILSLLYKLSPEECRLIMIDPKMLELSVYDGIPHLLSPVVTDPKKAVTALRWVVGEMEERYRKMSKMGVRNIEGYNGRVREALERGEMFSRTVQTGFDEETGDPVFETDEFAPEVLPFIVVVVDEMADLMMVAGKEIEACIQRLAQMARASGIHLIMATQRPSVDVITGTIKANFPTRISFQVTSKIDSRTILGEQGAEQLLGQGDMLYMAGGGRITRIHGPFVSDEEVEEIVTYLKGWGPPSYVGAVLEEQPEDSDSEGAPAPTGSETEDALYDMAVQIVAKDRKCSTSYIQRKLAIGYNKAARLVEQMEEQGVVTPANHVGKREILVPEPH